MGFCFRILRRLQRRGILFVRFSWRKTFETNQSIIRTSSVAQGPSVAAAAMSRRATGFKYVSGRSAELKQFESNQVSRSLTSLVSNSPNNSITTTRRPSDIVFDSNLHLQPLSQSFRHHGGSGGGGGGGEQLQMTPTRCPAAGGSGERRRQRGSSRRGSSGMPSMVWSNGDLSVPQLIQDFAHTKRLPVIVKVTQGYYGDGQLKLPIGQVSFHSIIRFYWSVM